MVYEYKEPENPATSVLEALEQMEEAPPHAGMYLLILLDAHEGRRTDPGFMMVYQGMKGSHSMETGNNTDEVVTKLHKIGLVRYNANEWRQELTDLGVEVARWLHAPA